MPQLPPRGTGKRVAVVGSGPAGLACAQQLARAGPCGRRVFEKADRIGGLLRYGIPDFKMEKHLIDRRIEQMEAEGVIFRTGFEVGVDGLGRARCWTTTTRWCWPAAPKRRATSTSPGRELDGVHFAMDFLTQQNKRVAGDDEDARRAARHASRAKGKHVVVIGGGDTGSDCIGTSNRQGAASVTQLEIMPQPPEQREQGADLARLAAEAAHLVLAGGGLRARLRRR